MSDKREAILRAGAGCIAQRGVRGLRVHDVAEAAEVSPGLLYYHFKDRAGLLDATLEYINARASEYRVEGTAATDSATERLDRLLLGEIQDRPDVLENSLAWNELRASAVFEESLRAPLARTTAAWSADIAAAISKAQADGAVLPDLDPQRSASTLTALVEGLSGRWLSGELTTDDARGLLHDVLQLIST